MTEFSEQVTGVTSPRGILNGSKISEQRFNMKCRLHCGEGCEETCDGTVMVSYRRLLQLSCLHCVLPTGLEDT